MTALILIDIQNDFLEGGSLPVPHSLEIIPIINQLMTLPFTLIVASKDWHPKKHMSFASTHYKLPHDEIMIDGYLQHLWPEHCLQDTKGADHPLTLNHSLIKKTFLKGTNTAIDSYSAFFDNRHTKSTGLGEYLKHQKITTVYLAGLATDYCIKFSALDALKQGFNTFVIEDACRGVNVQPNDSQKALIEIQNKGGKIISSKTLAIGFKQKS